MSEHIIKRHNKNLLLYHLVCPAKYRRDVFTSEVEETLRQTCNGINQRYEISYIEIGSDDDHVHFLLQSVPVMSAEKLVRITKSITAREIFAKHRDVRKNFGAEIFGQLDIILIL